MRLVEPRRTMGLHRILIVVLALAALSPGVSLLGQGVLYRDELFSRVDVRTNETYGSNLNRWTGRIERLVLDVYEPRGNLAADRPAIVIVHGGGFIAGNKELPQIIGLSRAFALRGYVAVAINYRLVPQFPTVQANPALVLEDATSDLKAAIRWIRASASSLRVDPRPHRRPRQLGRCEHGPRRRVPGG